MAKKNKIINLLALLVLALLTAWASKGLFKYSYYQTHDLDHHLVRSLDAFFTLKEGHFSFAVGRNFKLRLWNTDI